jgi:hypothetical protein
MYHNTLCSHYHMTVFSTVFHEMLIVVVYELYKQNAKWYKPPISFKLLKCKVVQATNLFQIIATVTLNLNFCSI